MVSSQFVTPVMGQNPLLHKYYSPPVLAADRLTEDSSTSKNGDLAQSWNFKIWNERKLRRAKSTG